MVANDEAIRRWKKALAAKNASQRRDRWKKRPQPITGFRWVGDEQGRHRMSDMSRRATSEGDRSAESGEERADQSGEVRFDESEVSRSEESEQD